MKVRYRYPGVSPPHNIAEQELSTYLEPIYTGSDQGSIEQLKSELEVTKAAMGRLLAMMVEANAITLAKAEEVAGIHGYYKQYKYPDFEVIP